MHPLTFKIRRTQSLVFNLVPGRLGNEVPDWVAAPQKHLCPREEHHKGGCCTVIEDLMRERGQVIPGRNDVACGQGGTRTKEVPRTSVREEEWKHSKDTIQK